MVVSNPTTDADLEQTTDNSTVANGVAVVSLGEEPKKKGLPMWMVVAVLAAFLGIVFAVYSQLLKEPPPHILPPKKGNN